MTQVMSGREEQVADSAQGRPGVLCELKAQLLEPIVQVVGAAVMLLGRLLHKAEHAHLAAVHQKEQCICCACN